MNDPSRLCGMGVGEKRCQTRDQQKQGEPTNRRHHCSIQTLPNYEHPTCSSIEISSPKPTGKRNKSLLNGLRAFAPRRCVEHGVLAPTDGVDRFNSAVLFVDLVGFTALTEALSRYGTRGTEQFSDLVTELFAGVTEAVA